MNKKEAIELLNQEGWTKADAQRALKSIDFKTDAEINELMVRRAASQFAGAELLNRQRLQAAQKTVVTKRNREIQNYIVQIEELTKKIGSSSDQDSAKIAQEVQQLKAKIKNLVLDKSELEQEKSKLKVVNKDLEKNNRDLEKDNKHLKNVVDEIRFKLVIEIKNILKLSNLTQIKKRLTKLIGSILG